MDQLKKKHKYRIIYDNYIVFDNTTVYNSKTKKEITGHIDRGFRRFGFSYNGKRIKETLHVLIADLFIDGFDKTNDTISFIDGNPLNCNIDNLQVNKLTRVTAKNTPNSNAFFESQNPYKLAKIYFLKYIAGRDYFLSNAFTEQDYIQEMVFELWKRTPLYLLKYANNYDGKAPIKYNTFAHGIFNRMFKRDFSIFILARQYSNITEVENEFFTNDVYAVDMLEAVQLGIVNAD